MKRLLAIFPLTLLLLACTEQAPQSNETQADADSPPISLAVYKDPNCGCCGDWITYMEDNGFTTEVHHPTDLNLVKQQYNIEPRYQSCHTAVTDDGYVFEGHIPAKFVNRFLADVPDGAVGLAVPGMPLGSPGMEVDDRFMAYEIWLLKEDGSTEVYAEVNSAAEQYN